MVVGLQQVVVAVVVLVGFEVWTEEVNGYGGRVWTGVSGSCSDGWVGNLDRGQ